jgi:hypothetical protein
MKNNEASRFTVRPNPGETDYQHHARSLEGRVSLPIDRTIRGSNAYLNERILDLADAQGNRLIVATVERRRLKINWDAAPGNRVTTDTVRVSAAAFDSLSAQAASEYALTAFPYVSQSGRLGISMATLMEVAHEMRDKFGKTSEFAQAIFIPTTQLLESIHEKMPGSAEIAARMVDEILGLRQYYLNDHTPEYLEDFLSESWISIVKGDLPKWRLNSPYWRKGLLKRLRRLLLGNFEPAIGLKELVQLVDETALVRPEIQLLEHVGRSPNSENPVPSPAAERKKAECLIHDVAGDDVILERWLLCLAGLAGQNARMSHAETAREIDRDPELRKEFVKRFGSRPDPHNAKRFFDIHFAEKIKLDLLNRRTGPARTPHIGAEGTRFLLEVSHPTFHRTADVPQVVDKLQPSGEPDPTDEPKKIAESPRRGRFKNDEELTQHVLAQSPDWIARFAASRPDWFAKNIRQIDPETGLSPLN